MVFAESSLIEADLSLESEGAPLVDPVNGLGIGKVGDCIIKILDDMVYNLLP